MAQVLRRFSFSQKDTTYCELNFSWCDFLRERSQRNCKSLLCRFNTGILPHVDRCSCECSFLAKRWHIFEDKSPIFVFELMRSWIFEEGDGNWMIVGNRPAECCCEWINHVRIPWKCCWHNSPWAPCPNHIETCWSPTKKLLLSMLYVCSRSLTILMSFRLSSHDKKL